ncbi:hypothetical protein [Arthrobacter sp. CAN_C5]|uniref:hypothetical protein n=1 Tax=Arthrobacter sp. CAN_C5 TaxID=2760706 RepID=UPI0028ADDFC3|nr:hypothetical protein [Arthrobacter sp. CAN_C5]MBP2215969.1 hypothetical protein [Arthrobacter sp. CAN_C5]
MENVWSFASKVNPGPGDLERQSLDLDWSLNLDSLGDDFDPNDVTAHDLFGKWVKQVADAGEDLPIGWMIPSLSEAAPFTGEDEDFLTYYRWPMHSETGKRLNWLTLSLVDKAPGDHGWFIQGVTGWKPSALQRIVHLPTLLSATGWR